MKTPRIVISVIAILSLGACATPLTKNINIDAEAEPGVDFTAYRTYAWLATAQILNDPDGQWEPRGLDADAEIQFLVNQQLRKRGITQAATDPDMYVAYIAGVDMAAVKWKKDPTTKLDVLKNEPAGALALILLDATTGNPIWGAVASDNVQGTSTVDDTRKRLDYAVSKMFKRLPKS